MEVKKETHVTGKTGAQRSVTKGKGRYDCIWLGFPHTLFRLARLFEQGIESGYAPGNWKKGTDLRRWLEGGCRHLSQFAEGLTNEDHLMASIWNLLCLGETRHLIETGVLPADLDNLPFTPDPDGPFNIAAPEIVEKFAVDPTLDIVPPPPFSVEELQKRVADGELLSDREDDRLFAADCGELHPYTAHSMAGPIPCLCDACKAARLKLAVEPPTFYVCGPMTGMKDFNFPLFDQVAELARKQGLSIINPVELDREHGIDPVANPGSVERAHAADPNLLQTIVQRDTEVINKLEKDKGDGLIILPGWQKSEGARAEVAVAIWMHLKFKQVRTTWCGQDCEPGIGDVSLEWVRSSLFCQARV